MSRDDEGSGLRTGFYIGVGVLAAAAAGYLVWRYALSDETKNKAKDMLQDGTTKAKRGLRDAKMAIAHRHE